MINRGKWPSFSLHFARVTIHLHKVFPPCHLSFLHLSFDKFEFSGDHDIIDNSSKNLWTTPIKNHTKSKTFDTVGPNWNVYTCAIPILLGGGGGWMTMMWRLEVVGIGWHLIHLSPETFSPGGQDKPFVTTSSSSLAPRKKRKSKLWYKSLSFHLVLDWQNRYR